MHRGHVASGLVLVAGCLIGCGPTPIPPHPTFERPERPERTGLPERLRAPAARCKAGDARACDAVATALGGGSKAVECTRRVAVATRTCRRTDDDLRPLMRRPGPDPAEEWNDRAAALYTAACDGGDVDACVAGGRIVARVEDGRYTAEPRALFDRALALWDADCTAGNADACLALSRAYRRGRIVDRDRVRATQAELRACGAGHRMTCRGLIRPFRAPDPLYTPPAPKRRSSASGDAGTSLLGGGLGSPIGAMFGNRPDPAPYQKACARGIGGACFEAGRLTRLTGRDDKASESAFRRARRIFERGCKRGKSDACLGLALSYARGAAVEPDAKKSEGLMMKSCKLGSGSACARLGIRLASDKTAEARARSRPFLNQACSADHASACAVLGIVMISGGDVPADAEAGCPHLLRACALDKRACRLARRACPKPRAQ